MHVLSSTVAQSGDVHQTASLRPPRLPSMLFSQMPPCVISLAVLVHPQALVQPAIEHQADAACNPCDVKLQHQGKWLECSSGAQIHQGSSCANCSPDQGLGNAQGGFGCMLSCPCSKPYQAMLGLQRYTYDSVSCRRSS